MGLLVKLVRVTTPIEVVALVIKSRLEARRESYRENR